MDDSHLPGQVPEWIVPFPYAQDNDVLHQEPTAATAWGLQALIDVSFHSSSYPSPDTQEQVRQQGQRVDLSTYACFVTD